ncbi:MAG: lysophospholipid acyltransferase family protein [Actinomycetes bacterium]
MLYALTRLVCLALFRVLWRPVVVGREHIPATGPVILASNHLSFIDSIVIPLAVPRRVVFLAKAEYWEGKSLASIPRRLFFRTFDAVPVQRDQQGDAQASLRLARQLLERGDAFGIYPEGTRSRDGRLYRGRTGVGWLALASGAPVVPVGLVGTDRVQPVGATVPRVHRVRVAFGPPVRPETYAGLPPGRARREITDAVMDSVASLSGQDVADGYNDHAAAATAG